MARPTQRRSVLGLAGHAAGGFSGRLDARTDQAMHLDPLLRRKRCASCWPTPATRCSGIATTTTPSILRGDRRWYLPWDLDEYSDRFPRFGRRTCRSSTGARAAGVHAEPGRRWRSATTRRFARDTSDHVPARERRGAGEQAAGTLHGGGRADPAGDRRRSVPSGHRGKDPLDASGRRDLRLGSRTDEELDPRAHQAVRAHDRSGRRPLPRFTPPADAGADAPTDPPMDADAAAPEDAGAESPPDGAAVSTDGAAEPTDGAAAPEAGTSVGEPDAGREPDGGVPSPSSPSTSAHDGCGCSAAPARQRAVGLLALLMTAAVVRPPVRRRPRADASRVKPS